MSLKHVFTEAAQCRNKDGHHKRTFDTKAEAKRAAKKAMTVLGSNGRGHMEAYKCPHCDKFHIGHPPKQ